MNRAAGGAQRRHALSPTRHARRLLSGRAPPLRRQPESRVFNCRRVAPTRAGKCRGPSFPQSVKRESRVFAFGGHARAQLKTLDSVSVRNIVATLPYSSTARNDGPGHFPAFAGPSLAGVSRPLRPLNRLRAWRWGVRRALRREAPSFPQVFKRESRVFAFRRFLAGPIKDAGLRVGARSGE